MPCGHPAHDPAAHDDHDGCTDRQASGLPPDPFADGVADMIEGSAALFTLYQGFQAAGFPEERAFQLTSAFLFHALDIGSGS
jgi:hypothetical protein